MAEYADYANECLIYFVKMIPILYSPKLLVYNVHSLLHLSDDARRYGSLEACSAFRFENEMRHLKSKIRSGRQILAQLGRRIFEHDKKEIDEVTVSRELISNKSPNNAFILNDGSCVLVDDVNDDICTSRVFTCEPLFHKPCDSRILQFFKCVPKKFVTRNIHRGLIHRQAMCLKDKEHFYFLMLRHAFAEQ